MGPWRKGHKGRVTFNQENVLVGEGLLLDCEPLCGVWTFLSSSSYTPACVGPPHHQHQPPSNVQSRRELGRTPPCLLPPGAAAHKEEEVIASWFCFAAGHQSPPLEMVGYKNKKKLTKKILNNEGGYCTCTMAVVLLVTASFTLANCQLQSNVCHH